MNWIEQIRKFGLSDGTIKVFELEGHNGTHVRYPFYYPEKVIDGQVVADVRTRLRALPEYIAGNPGVARFSNPKDTELPDGKMPPFYFCGLDHPRNAIQAHAGIVYIFEGDKDLWTAYEAGLRNSISIISASVPFDAAFIYHLKNIGAKVVKAFFDNDHAGWNQAEKLLDTLKGSNILVSTYCLPYFVNNFRVKDVNDLWLALECNREKFFAYINNAKPLRLPNKEQTELSRDKDGYFRTDFYQEIERGLGVDQFNSQGWSRKQFPCLVNEHEHDEHSPAMAWNRTSHTARCFKCGETLLAKDVAEILGINWRDYIARVDTPISGPASIEVVTTSKEVVENSATASMALGVDIMKGLSTLGAYTPKPDHFVWLDDALSNYEERLSGVAVPEFPPILNPLKPLHKLGGAMHVIPRPFMFGFLGISGGFKTSLLSSLMNKLLSDGYNGIIYSPEWSPEKMADRLVQQFGGIKMSEMSLLQRAYYERHQIQNGLLSENDESIFGQMPDPDRFLQTQRAVSRIKKALRGKMMYLKSFGANVLEVLAQVTHATKTMTEAGYSPHFFIFDYAQMALPPAGWPSPWSLQDTVLFTKAVIMQLGLVCFMASQVRKEDAEDIKDGNLLRSTSGLALRDDFFNGFVTINPFDVYVPMETGSRLRLIKLAVTKNSDGATTNDIHDAINIYADLDRMLVLESDLTSIAYSIDPDDPDASDFG
jgi:hypothetical protein